MSNPLITEDLPFLDLFIPPEGYALDFLEMTTYSLSLSLLATLPFLLYQGEHGGIMNEEITGNPQRFMKRKDENGKFIYETYSEKFRLLYDGNTKFHADSIQASPSVLRVANYLLEHSCKKVIIKNGLFHPKIMLFQFRRKETEDTSKPEFFYRLMIGSRNFTMSNYLETGICLEGAVVDDNDSTLTAINQPLCDFFGKYWNYCSLYSDNYPPCIHWVNFLKTPLKATQKDVTATGIYFGEGKKDNIKISNTYEPAVNSISKTIYEECGTNPMLIVSMKPTSPLFIDNKKNHFVQNPTNPTVTPPENKWYLTSEEKPPTKNKLLHSKMFLYQQNNNLDNNLVLWIGSANCTVKGLNGTNEEVMVRCETKGNLEFPKNDNHFTKDSIYTKTVLPVEEMDDEETVCPVKVESEWDSTNSQWKLKLSATSTKPSASDWNVFPLVGGNMVQVTVPPSPSTVPITFPMIETNFTNIFIIQSLDQKQTYRHVADMNGEFDNVRPSLDTLLGDIPLEPLEELRDLVEKYKGEADNVHALERLMLHYKALSPTELSKICTAVLKNMNDYEEVYQKVTNCCVASSRGKDKRETIDHYTDSNLSDEKKYENKAVARSVERYKADFTDLKELVMELEKLVEKLKGV